MTPPPPARFDIEALRTGSDLRFVGWVACELGLHLRLSPEDLEDARQEIFLVLLKKVIPRYDPSRGAFSTFALQSVRGHLSNWRRRERRRGLKWIPGRGSAEGMVSLSAPGRRTGISLSERIGERDPDHTDRLDGARLFSLTRRLRAAERRLLNAVYRKGLGIAEYGRKRGVSRIWAGILHRNALGNLATISAGGTPRMPQRGGRPRIDWPAEDEVRLAEMVRLRIDRRLMAVRLGRTIDAVSYRIRKLRSEGRITPAPPRGRKPAGAVA